MDERCKEPEWFVAVETLVTIVAHDEPPESIGSAGLSAYH
jgi:hypothetical protein